MKYTFTLKKLIPVYQTVEVEADNEDDAFDMIQPVATGWQPDPTLVLDELDWEVDTIDFSSDDTEEEEEEETN